MCNNIKPEKVCDICGDTTSKHFRIWQKDGMYKGKNDVYKALWSNEKKWEHI